MPSIAFSPVNLTKFMPKNYAKTINQSLTRQYSPSYIHKVISGKGYNKEILFACIPLIKEKLHEETTLHSELSNILNRYENDAKIKN